MLEENQHLQPAMASSSNQWVRAKEGRGGVPVSEYNRAAGEIASATSLVLVQQSVNLQDWKKKRAVRAML